MRRSVTDLRAQLELVRVAQRLLFPVASSQIQPVLRFLAGAPTWGEVSEFIAAYPESFVTRYTAGSRERVVEACKATRQLMVEVGRKVPDDKARVTYLYEVISMAEKINRGERQEHRRAE